MYQNIIESKLFLRTARRSIDEFLDDLFAPLLFVQYKGGLNKRGWGSGIFFGEVDKRRGLSKPGWGLINRNVHHFMLLSQRAFSSTVLLKENIAFSLRIQCNDFFSKRKHCI